MAQKTRNYFLERYVDGLKSVLCSASDTVSIVFDESNIKRSQFPVPTNIPTPSLYVWETPETVERTNRANRRTLALSIECVFNPNDHHTVTGSTDPAYIANVLLEQIQRVLHHVLFDRTPVVEIGNEIFYNLRARSRMALKIDAEAHYVTDY